MSSTDGTIGAAEYEYLAARNRPTDPQALAQEIRRLRATGLSASDISMALRLSHDYVVNVLGQI
jgi:hypothetical protein